MKENYTSYEYFVGKIAPFLLFEMEFHGLSYVVENHKNDRWYPDINPAAQVANIGLLSYFEAFCKHQFAAILNLFPSIILDFATKRGEPKIEISTVVGYGDNFKKNVGFLLAESYDFGSPKAINSLFCDILKVSPFSKDEEKTMNEIIHRRNLIVHHGGYLTHQYVSRKGPKALTVKPFKDEIKIGTDDYYTNADFLFEMAIKIVKCTVKSLKKFPEYIALDPNDDRIKAVSEMLRGIHDTMEE
ncbi:hypothetical protein [Mucilaginibacter sp. SP1R1]|uniref:hypothetical protein n=1 Tax=Mucilaginibacter sp. SP1R1 TaxID=2723091 RepID=UPI0016095A18|nr:hypothetical protein [Mucilaginibacter sp. SP1R1]MBB6149603.1 hypothetical protein [Mucilaginibacter sp. SP1R1]